MEEPKKKAPAKKAAAKVFKKNYFLKGLGPVGKGTIPTAEQKQHKGYSDKLVG